MSDPLSQRYNLDYVHRRSWPYNWLRVGSVVVALAGGLLFVLLSLRGDQRIYSSGDLTNVHAMFGNNCASCHQADPQRSGYWLDVSDQACLTCHAAEAHHPLRSIHPGISMQRSDRLGAVEMAIKCSDCHVEHRGRNHDLSRVADHACVACHGNLQEHRSNSANVATVGGGE